MDLKVRQIFIEEAREELLPELEVALLELDSAPDNMDLINRVFRVLHTLKGSGAMFGFDRLSHLAHELETIFDDIRNNRRRVSAPLLELTLAAKDSLQQLVENPEEVTDTALADMITAFRETAENGTADDNSTTDTTDAAVNESSGAVYHIRFKPHPGIFATGTNPLLLIDELHGLGTARVIAHMDGVPLLEDMNPEICYTWWDILLATDSDLNAIKDVFIFVEDECELTITTIADDIHAGQEGAAFDSLESLLLENEQVGIEELRRVFFNEALSTSPVTAVRPDDKSPDQAAVDSTAVDRRPVKPRQPVKTISSMRVQTKKLDQLVNLVGELVIAQTRLSRLADEQADTTLTEIAEVMERLSNDLRENTLDIRMLPIGSSFGKFKRLVWDIASQKGKEVELVTEGAATELDKTIIERLDDPLVHLLRNSIDHGLEPPEERERIGKPRKGKIVFSAEHSGGNVIITISDDGRGINTEAVRDKAVSRNLLASGVNPTEKELLNLIFEPGFSTAEQISDMSGRGVGLDVVRQNISTLRGKVTVSSIKGQGTTFRLTIPLTLAIIDGLKIRIAGEYFIVPLAVVNECLELKRPGSAGREETFINLRDRLVPFLRLRDWFTVNGKQPEKEQVVIVSADKKMVGLVVDEVIGLQQAVIKNLGEAYKDIPGLSGATIQGDGSIALILDVEPLIQKAEDHH